MKYMPPDQVWNWIRGLPTSDHLFKSPKSPKLLKRKTISLDSVEDPSSSRSHENKRIVNDSNNCMKNSGNSCNNGNSNNNKNERNDCHNNTTNKNRNYGHNNSEGSGNNHGSHSSNGSSFDTDSSTGTTATDPAPAFSAAPSMGRSPRPVSITPSIAPHTKNAETANKDLKNTDLKWTDLRNTDLNTDLKGTKFVSASTTNTVSRLNIIDDSSARTLRCTEGANLENIVKNGNIDSNGNNANGRESGKEKGADKGTDKIDFKVHHHIERNANTHMMNNHTSNKFIENNDEIKIENESRKLQKITTGRRWIVLGSTDAEQTHARSHALSHARFGSHARSGRCGDGGTGSWRGGRAMPRTPHSYRMRLGLGGHCVLDPPSSRSFQSF